MATSKSVDPDADAEPVDHRDLVEWLAVSTAHGSNRRLHKVDGNPDAEALETGEEVEPACDTHLVDESSHWRAKRAAVYPPGYATLCDERSCFGSEP